MKYLKISNEGELDVRLISLMGGTTKTGNTYKIGKFGTGLKYSLAWLVRNNIEFKIFIGKEEVNITTKHEVIQGTDFEILYINGERSSITSTMGVDWKGWMIVREIWCNAIDAGDNVKDITETASGEEGKTIFYLQLAGEVAEAVENWSKLFLHDTEPLYETEQFAVYPRGEHMRLYKQGVLIYHNSKIKSVFNYDIKDADINELREYKGYQNYDIARIVSSLPAKLIELFLETVDDNYYEETMDFDWSGLKYGNEWKEAIGQAKIITKETFKSLVNRGVEINRDDFVFVPKSLFDKLAVTHPHMSGVRRADKVNSFYEVYDQELELLLKQGCAILETCGYFIDPELQLVTGVFGDPNVYAKIKIDEKIVMFSQELKRKSLFDVVTTLIEENEHFITHYQDCSREFQQHFIDLYAKQLMELNEVKL